MERPKLPDNTNHEMKNIALRRAALITNPIIKAVMVLILTFAAAGLTSCKEAGDEPDALTQQNDSTTQDEFFQLAILPDTQYYTSLKHGGTMDMFRQQIEWILDNYVSSKIVYVVHLGDVVDHGENELVEWERARDVMYKLEKPLPGFPDGIPYGIAVGNHDQQPLGNPGEGGTGKGYNKYFGPDHFEGRAYYGGAYGSTNDNHYDVFTACGDHYIVVYLEYNEPGNENYNAAKEAAVYDWAEEILNKHDDHKAIIVSHSILARPDGSNSNVSGGEGSNAVPGDFTPQGERIYNRFKKHPNVFLMLCGHRSGEAYREDTYNGNTIKTYLSDYQSREDASGVRNGGNGLMRLMKFNLTDQTLSVRTFIPRSGQVISEVDGDSYFSKPLFSDAND